jgi:hypothetical protein
MIYDEGSGKLQRGSFIGSPEMTANDPRLKRLIEAWPRIPQHIILAILALVDSAE